MLIRFMTVCGCRRCPRLLLVTVLLPWFHGEVFLGAPPPGGASTPISTSPESSSALTADEWKTKAIEQFPDLAVVGSRLNAAFVAKYKAYQGSNYFDSPDWPMRLANECSNAMGSKNGITLPSKLAGTTWSDPGGQDSHGNQKSFTLNADMTASASWRRNEVGWWKLLDGSRIELHVAKNNSVHPVLTFNSDLTEATDDKNQSYQRLNPPVSRNIAQEQAPQPTPTIAAAKQAQTNQSIVPGLPNMDASTGTATPTPNTPLASQSSLAGAVADAEFQTEEHTKNGDAIRTRLKEESAGKLVVKGLFLGMNFDDSYAAFQPFGKDFMFIDKRDDTDGKILLAGLFGKTVHGRVYGIITKTQFRIGSILVDPDTNRIIGFDFSQSLSDRLFNSNDLSASDFAQQFMDNYNIPTLTPGVRNNQKWWIYDSPDGWTLKISPYKGVHVEYTRVHSFGD